MTDHRTKVVSYYHGQSFNYYGELVPNVQIRWECTCGKHGKEQDYSQSPKVRHAGFTHEDRANKKVD